MNQFVNIKSANEIYVLSVVHSLYNFEEEAQ